jgi:hypothetical protein
MPFNFLPAGALIGVGDGVNGGRRRHQGDQLGAPAQPIDRLGYGPPSSTGARGLLAITTGQRPTNGLILISNVARFTTR